VTPGAGDFNPFSTDAQFAKIIERLDRQDRETERHHSENKKTLSAIRDQTTITNGRVTKLEKKWIYVAGLIIGGWFVIGVVWVVFTHWPH
jgi:hypothetical protein